MSKGKLYGIGVGPGDSKLLTVKAVETIRNADMIITPKQKKRRLCCLSYCNSLYFKKSGNLTSCVSMVTDMEVVSKQWEENRIIIEEKLDEGKNLVFLTLGDPMLYSTYMYISGY